MQFHLNGQRVRDWLPEINHLKLSGALALDALNKTVYLSTPNRLSIASLNLSTGKSRLINQIPDRDNSEITAIGVDDKRERAYICRNDGSIFAIDLVRNKIHQVVDDPRYSGCVLGVDSDQGWLYIGQGHKVSRLRISELDSKPVAFAESGPLRRIAAITVDNSGSVWIANDGPLSLLSFSREGTLRMSFVRGKI
jgi:hypothetical protein